MPRCGPKKTKNKTKQKTYIARYKNKTTKTNCMNPFIWILRTEKKNESVVLEIRILVIGEWKRMTGGHHNRTSLAL